jgi:carboxymethylenebutenolidase
MAAAVLATHPPAAPAQVADTGMVRIGRPGAGTGAFVAWPTGKGPFPAVVVVQEWWGLNTQIRDVARRLAREGYAAVVPDLYHGRQAADAEQAHVLARGLDQERALADLEAAVGWLRAEPRVGRRKIAVIGFCMGGTLAQLLGSRSAELSAVVTFYGNPVTDPEGLAGLRAPLQAHFGQEDQGIPAERVEALRQGLRRAGRHGEIHTYPGAGHAFMNDQRPSFHPDAARQAWARTLAFLQKHVKR